MKALLALLLAGAVGYAYLQQQNVSSLQAELEASRAEVASLKKQIADGPEAAVPGSGSAGPKENVRRPRSANWLWEKRENALGTPPPLQKKN